MYAYMSNAKANRLVPALIALCLSACSTMVPEEGTIELAVSTSSEAQYAIATQEDRVGRIVVPVSLNEHGVFKLMLDTGATHSVLTSAAAARLGINITEAPISMVQGVAGRVAAPIVLVDRLQAGSLKLQHLPMAVMDGAVIAELDGILGVGGLGNMIVTADFVKDRINIRNSSGQRVNALYAVIKFDLVSNHLIVVDGMVGRVAVRAVIDTGGSQTLGNVALLKAMSKQHDGRTASEDAGITDVTDNSKNGTVLFVPMIRVGSAEVTNAAVICSDFEVFRSWQLDKRPALLIGMDVLGQLGELSIDYQRQELRLRSR